MGCGGRAGVRDGHRTVAVLRDQLAGVGAVAQPTNRKPALTHPSMRVGAAVRAVAGQQATSASMTSLRTLSRWWAESRYQECVGASRCVLALGQPLKHTALADVSASQSQDVALLLPLLTYGAWRQVHPRTGDYRCLCRCIAVCPLDGAAYASTADGDIVRFDPNTKTLSVLQVTSPVHPCCVLLCRAHRWALTPSVMPVHADR